MRDDRDYKVELSSAVPPSPAGQAQGRPYVGVHFTCCNIYCRAYRNKEGTAYLARCPQCGRQVSFVVGDGGTDARVFRA